MSIFRWLSPVHLLRVFESKTYVERIDLIFWAAVGAASWVLLWHLATLARTWFLERGESAFTHLESRKSPNYVAWLSLPTMVVVVLFWLGYRTHLDSLVAPADSYDIQVLSERGTWAFTYPTGKRSKGDLVVPVARPVRLIMSSKDAVHGLAIPELRLQQLAIPGRYSTLWFNIPNQRSLSTRCTDGCDPRSKTEPKVLAVDESHFDTWLATNQKLASAASVK